MTIDEARQAINNIVMEAEMDGYDITLHLGYALDDLIAAVREDERQKMFDLWKGMLP